jgi:cyclophilin family peptidyl-prolyl cis-trans isomerase
VTTVVIVRPLFLALCCAFCAKPAPLTNPAHPKFALTAPDSFDVDMRTTKGRMLVRVRRSWSPNGADRFYSLVRNRYFDSVAFHRTIRNFVAQFGIHGDTAVSAAWRGKNIPDDSVRAQNARGTLSFARSGPNTRSVQLYFNTVHNTPRLDTLNGFGFPPIGEVVLGAKSSTRSIGSIRVREVARRSRAPHKTRSPARGIRTCDGRFQGSTIS